jgi:hypothetical protein
MNESNFISVADAVEIARVAQGIPFDRLCEIFAAEKDRRCEVLPCKVGDTVWVNFGNVPSKGIVGSFCIRHGNSDFFIHGTGVDSEPDFQMYAHKDDFGKTVFFTPETAKSALKGDAK